MRTTARERTKRSAAGSEIERHAGLRDLQGDDHHPHVYLTGRHGVTLPREMRTPALVGDGVLHGREPKLAWSPRRATTPARWDEFIMLSRANRGLVWLATTSAKVYGSALVAQCLKIVNQDIAIFSRKVTTCWQRPCFGAGSTTAHPDEPHATRPEMHLFCFPLLMYLVCCQRC